MPEEVMIHHHDSHQLFPSYPFFVDYFASFIILSPPWKHAMMETITERILVLRTKGLVICFLLRLSHCGLITM